MNNIHILNISPIEFAQRSADHIEAFTGSCPRPDPKCDGSTWSLESGEQEGQNQIGCKTRNGRGRFV